MKISDRFHTAISNARPRGGRVIESYSPKLGRRLQCFGENVYHQWICLEADPLVETFCERPTYLNSGDGKRPFDFWVRYEGREVLIVLDPDAENQVSTVTINDAELTVRSVLPVELAAARVWIGNWERMLPLIISCRHEISSSLRNSIRKFITEPMPLSRIEQEFVTGDPTLIRAAVFDLLHHGQLHAPQLQTDPLSYLIFFEPGRTAL
jgi:hypothetical protein